MIMSSRITLAVAFALGACAAPTDRIKRICEVVKHLNAETILRRVVQNDGREIVFNSVTKMGHISTSQWLSEMFAEQGFAEGGPQFIREDPGLFERGEDKVGHVAPIA